MALPYTFNVSGTNDGNTDVSGKLSGRNTLPGTFAVIGTFGGATVKLQAGFVNAAGVTNWIDVPEASFTSDGVVNFAFKSNYLRVNVASSSGTTDVDIWVG